MAWFTKANSISSRLNDEPCDMDPNCPLAKMRLDFSKGERATFKPLYGVVEVNRSVELKTSLTYLKNLNRSKQRRAQFCARLEASYY